MKTELQIKLILAFVGSFIFWGCGADKTVDDWKNQRVAEELARIESVKGTYEGQAFFSSSNEPVGDIVLEIEPKVRTARSSDQLVPEVQADLFVRMILKGPTDRILTFSTGSIIKDSDSNPERFTATVAVSSGFTAQAEGRFIQGQIQGTAKVQEFPENQIWFNVSRVSALVQGQNQRSSRPRTPGDLTPLLDIEVYQAQVGTRGETDPKSRPKLILIPQEFDASVDLLNELLPIRNVTLTVSVNETPILTFKSAQIDRVSGKIIAENMVDRADETFVQRMQCLKSPKGSMFCSLVDNSRGRNFNLEFFRVSE